MGLDYSAVNSQFINSFCRSKVEELTALAGLEVNHAEAFVVSLILSLRQRVSGRN